MLTRVAAIAVCLMLSAVVPGQAQSVSVVATGERATGETYHFEVGGFFWSPNPTLIIRSEALTEANVGSTIDFVKELGFEQQMFGQIKAVLRPATKHKFRFEYTPLKFENPDAVLQRDIIFNGQIFRLSLPVEAQVTWHAFRFGYEYDFIYRDRGFFGIILEAKYTDVEAQLSQFALGLEEFARARAPIPAIGAIGRVYVVPNISITGEISGFKLPASFDESYRAHYWDFDLYGSVNFTDNFGAQLGWRSFDVFYLIDDEDEGSLKMKGVYFGAVARF